MKNQENKLIKSFIKKLVMFIVQFLNQTKINMFF